MKIKSLISQGNILSGNVVEATKSPTNDECVAYDSFGGLYYFYTGQYEVIAEFSEAVSSISIRDLLGQDLRTIEFK